MNIARSYDDCLVFFKKCPIACIVTKFVGGESKTVAYVFLSSAKQLWMLFEETLFAINHRGKLVIELFVKREFWRSEPEFQARVFFYLNRPFVETRLMQSIVRSAHNDAFSGSACIHYTLEYIL